jgi:hypothetical protein
VLALTPRHPTCMACDTLYFAHLFCAVACRAAACSRCSGCLAWPTAALPSARVPRRATAAVRPYWRGFEAGSC